jgi:predicted deacylase
MRNTLCSNDFSRCFSLQRPKSSPQFATYLRLWVLVAVCLAIVALLANCTAAPKHQSAAGGALLLLAEPQRSPLYGDSPLPTASAPRPALLAITASAALTAAQPISQVIGYSSQGYPIVAYSFGHGQTRLALIGGIHGGFEWNTIRLAYSMIDYLTAHPKSVPPSLTVTIVPSANPDGQVRVTGTTGRFKAGQVAPETTAGRLNGNGVDLNRNWDCRWRATAVWRDGEVSGGSAPFSEPETQALARMLTEPPAAAVIFWHSAVPGVFTAGCDDPDPASVRLGQVIAEASGYPIFNEFTSYEVTGDATDWLSTQGIAAVTVELTNSDDIDWPPNLRAVLALFRYLADEDKATP